MTLIEITYSDIEDIINDSELFQNYLKELNIKYNDEYNNLMIKGLNKNQRHLIYKKIKHPYKFEKIEENGEITIRVYEVKNKKNKYLNSKKRKITKVDTEEIVLEENKEENKEENQEENQEENKKEEDSEEEEETDDSEEEEEEEDSEEEEEEEDSEEEEEEEDSEEDSEDNSDKEWKEEDTEEDTEEDSDEASEKYEWDGEQLGNNYIFEMQDEINIKISEMDIKLCDIETNINKVINRINVSLIIAIVGWMLLLFIDPVRLMINCKENTYLKDYIQVFS